MPASTSVSWLSPDQLEFRFPAVVTPLPGGGVKVMPAKEPNCIERWVSVKEAAEVLDVSTEIVRQLAHGGHITARQKSEAPRSWFLVEMGSVYAYKRRKRL